MHAVCMKTESLVYDVRLLSRVKMQTYIKPTVKIQPSPHQSSTANNNFPVRSYRCDELQVLPFPVHITEAFELRIQHQLAYVQYVHVLMIVFVHSKLSIHLQQLNCMLSRDVFSVLAIFYIVCLIK